MAAVCPEVATLQRLILAALTRCTVSDLGTLSACESSAEDADDRPAAQDRQDLVTALRAAEEAAGVDTVLSMYCALLAKANPAAHRLAAARINRHATYASARRATDPAVLECLLPVLARHRDPLVVHPVARAAALVAGTLRQESTLLTALDRQDSVEARRAAYGALWSAARLRALEPLAAALAEDTAVPIKQAILGSFSRGDPLGEQEREPVCALTVEALAAPAEGVACAAALATAEHCPGNEARVLEVCSAALDRPSPMAPCFLRAIQQVTGAHQHRAPSAASRQAAALLGRVVAAEDHAVQTRQQALEQLWRLDRRAGRKLARRYARRGTTGGLSDTAALLLRRRR